MGKGQWWKLDSHHSQFPSLSVDPQLYPVPRKRKTEKMKSGIKTCIHLFSLSPWLCGYVSTVQHFKPQRASARRPGFFSTGPRQPTTAQHDLATGVQAAGQRQKKH